MANRGRETESRRQKTEDRRQKTEDRRGRTVVPSEYCLLSSDFSGPERSSEANL